MFKKRDQLLLSEAYDRVVLEEGIKDIVLAGLLGLMTMTSSQGTGSRNIDKAQIQQLIQKTQNVDELKQASLWIIDDQLYIHQVKLKEMQLYDQAHVGGPAIKALKDFIRTLKQLRQDVQNANDAAKLAKLVNVRHTLQNLGGHLQWN